MIKRQKSVDSAININASSSASLGGHPALVAPESFNSHKEGVAPIATMESSVSAELNEVPSTTSLQSKNNGSIQNSAITRFWTFLLNQLVLWVTLGSPNKQVGSRIQEQISRIIFFLYVSTFMFSSLVSLFSSERFPCFAILNIRFSMPYNVYVLIYKTLVQVYHASYCCFYSNVGLNIKSTN